MALKIRLRQQGRANRHSYRLVLADVRFPRDGKYLETLGWYDPTTPDNKAKVEEERISYWVDKGAQLTESAKHLLKRVAPHVLKVITEKKLAKKEKAAKIEAKAAAPAKKEKAAAPVKAKKATKAAEGAAPAKKATTTRKKSTKKEEGQSE